MSGAASDPRLGVVLLCHGPLETATRMAGLWADGGAEVMVHVDAKVDDQAVAAMQTALAGQPRIRFSARRPCNWGRFDLVQATQDAAQALLDQAPGVSHVFLASGTCLPLRPVGELVAYLRRYPATDFIESVAVEDVFWAIGGLNEERFTRFFPFDWRKRRRLFDGALALQRALGISRRLPPELVPHLGSQWWCLTRETLGAILSDPRRAEFDRFFRLSWIPDESYFQTLARLHSRQLESRSLTLSRFDHKGRPYMLYDDHLALLEQSGCFVARKVWSGAKALLQHFPRPSDHAEPDPARIEEMMRKATALRRFGRPGLYMQSRFPVKLTEQGKTAAPYAVMQGFTDVIPGFQDWLGRQVDADVHGHLFSPDRAEFAGQPPIGPGALPLNATLRDYDPERFLASLLRITDRKQIFQFGPDDTEAMNWFIATDPNAEVMMVTGAWIVPLYRSDVPFPMIRQIAARLQRAEVEQVNILHSRWRRARLHIWDLSQFAAQPATVLSTVLSQLAPAASLPDDLPPLGDLSGIGAFLQRLRNAGLRPELTGHFPPTDPSIPKGPIR